MRLGEGVLAYVERRIRFAIGRVGARVRRVLVRLGDLNGPRGGIDKCCRIIVRLARCRPVVVEQRDADVLRAADLAAGRLAHAVRRQVKRRARSRRRRRAGSPHPGSVHDATFALTEGGQGHALPRLR